MIGLKLKNLWLQKPEVDFQKNRLPPGAALRQRYAFINTYLEATVRIAGCRMCPSGNERRTRTYIIMIMYCFSAIEADVKVKGITGAGSCEPSPTKLLSVVVAHS